MRVPGCEERESRGISQTNLGSDCYTNVSLLQNGEVKINVRPGDVR